MQEIEVAVSSACGQCNGHACPNHLPYLSDVNEYRAFDSETMEDPETIMSLKTIKKRTSKYYNGMKTMMKKIIKVKSYSSCDFY